LFGLDVGEALLESGAGGIVNGDGLEGVFELAAVARQLVGGQGCRG
jgi:urease accessory protein UreH